MDTLKEIKERLSNKILNIKEHSKRRIYIDINKKDIVEVAKMAFYDLKLRFATATGLETPEGIEIVYHFADDNAERFISFRVLIEDKKNPQIDSIGKHIKAADWIEREIWELLGVNFKGHPNLTHLLLMDDWPKCDFPLRQDRKVKEK
ncbi:MAG: NADH-quinone oxidoreductase subunit C [Candidatus Omnitrophica bacterium]|nr:NADH-quinone oxidoreductase subunit C [Candidatus Omnitrophota bacterium]